MNNKNGQPNKWLQFITIPFQMGFIILLGVLAGFKIDDYFTTSPAFLVIFSLLAIAIALYNIIRQLQQINKNDE